MWLMYALGGGWGHVTRAASLARAARPRQVVRIITNSPYAPQIQNAMPELDLVVLPPTVAPDEVRDARAPTTRLPLPASSSTRSHEGSAGELVPVLERPHPPTVLIHRDLNPRYVEQASLADFVAEYYTAVIAAGEGSVFPHAHATAPWLIRSDHELVRAKPEYALVCAAGREDEAAWYAEVAQRLSAETKVRTAAGYWPAIDLFPAARVVVGGGGYNTVHEALACGVPLVAKAWPRKYDRQWLRIERAGAAAVEVNTPGEAVESALRLIAAANPRRRAAIRQWSRRRGGLDRASIIGVSPHESCSW